MNLKALSRYSFYVFNTNVRYIHSINKWESQCSSIIKVKTLICDSKSHFLGT